MCRRFSFFLPALSTSFLYLFVKAHICGKYTECAPTFGVAIVLAIVRINMLFVWAAAAANQFSWEHWKIFSKRTVNVWCYKMRKSINEIDSRKRKKEKKKVLICPVETPSVEKKKEESYSSRLMKPPFLIKNWNNLINRITQKTEEKKLFTVCTLAKSQLAVNKNIFGHWFERIIGMISSFIYFFFYFFFLLFPEYFSFLRKTSKCLYMVHQHLTRVANFNTLIGFTPNLTSDARFDYAFLFTINSWMCVLRYLSVHLPLPALLNVRKRAFPTCFRNS